MTGRRPDDAAAAEDETAGTVGQADAPGLEPLFRLPEYDEPMVGFINNGLHALAAARDPILAQMPRVRQRRHYRPVNSMPEGAVHESQTMPVETRFELQRAEIVATDVESLASVISVLADQYIASVMPQIFQELSAVTEAVGNSLDAGRQPLSADLILTILEQMEVPFDLEGNAQLPTIYVAPGAQIPEWSTEDEARKEEIIERKRQEFLAQRRSRELPRHPLRD